MDSTLVIRKTLVKITSGQHPGCCYPLEESFIDDNVRAMLQPPRTSCIRINTSITDPGLAKAQCQLLLRSQDERFLVQSHAAFGGLILVEAVGPQDPIPAPREVIVSCECAQAILRGSHVFAPGILAIEDFVQGINVSVWADLDGRCTRGLRIKYLGKKQFVGNGRLLMVGCGKFCVALTMLES